MISTTTLHISQEQPEKASITRAVDILRSGGLVAFPTETVYGLGADAMNTNAVRNVFKAKGRPADNPLIIHIAGIKQLFELGENVSSTAQKLAETFWPGPLTLVVQRKPFVPDIVTAALDTVALRMPNHRVPLAVIKELGRGIVGPSANISGKPSPTTAQHVYDDLNGKIEMILDAGPTTIGVESTVVDVTTVPPTVLRFGGLSLELIEECIGSVQTIRSKDKLKRSPGTQHRHYSPKANVILVEEKNAKQFSQLKETYKHEGRNVGCIVHTEELKAESKDINATVLHNNTEEFAQRMFDVMRTLDSKGIDVILVEAVREEGIGVAVMDRLRRAAEGNSKAD